MQGFLGLINYGKAEIEVRQFTNPKRFLIKAMMMDKSTRTRVIIHEETFHKEKVSEAICLFCQSTNMYPAYAE